jgi:hypothetical protein
MSINPRELTLAEKVNAALRLAASDVIERARQTGTPVIVWENNRITERSPNEFIGNLQPDEELGHR